MYRVIDASYWGKSPLCPDRDVGFGWIELSGLVGYSVGLLGVDMSCDFAIWWPSRRLSDEEAGELYAALCEEDTSGVEPSEAIDAFYAELTAKHPEIDDISDDDVDNTDLCPWSIAFDRSSGHLIIPCVWSKADYVESLLHELANKHGLAIFDPQKGRIAYPAGDGRSPGEGRKKAWWRFW